MSDNPFVLEMVGTELRDAVLAARARLNDDSIMARIGDNNRPGLCTVVRDGHDDLGGLSYAAAVTALGALA